MSQDYYYYQGRKIYLRGLDQSLLGSIQSNPTQVSYENSIKKSSNAKLPYQKVKLTQSLKRVNLMLVAAKSRACHQNLPFNRNLVFEVDLSSCIDAIPVEKIIVKTTDKKQDRLFFVDEESLQLIRNLQRKPVPQCLIVQQAEDIFSDVEQPQKIVRQRLFQQVKCEPLQLVDTPVQAREEVSMFGKWKRKRREQTASYAQCYDDRGVSLQQLKERGIKESELVEVYDQKRKRMRNQNLNEQLQQVKRLMNRN